MFNASRFFNLERPRTRDRKDEPGAQESAGRVAAIEAPQANGELVSSTPSLSSRFSGEEHEAGATAREANAPLFVHCLNCRADNGRDALRCFNCGVSLDTPEQKSFNAHFWVVKREALDRELEESEEARRQAFERKVQEARERAAFGLQMKEQAQEEARSRLGGASSGLRLLRRIPDIRIRLGVLILLVVIPSALYFAGLPGTAFLVAIATAFLFMPDGWAH